MMVGLTEVYESFEPERLVDAVGEGEAFGELGE